MLDREKKCVSPHQHYSARCPRSIFPPQRIVPQSAGYLGQMRVTGRRDGAVALIRARDDVCGGGPRARAATGDALRSTGGRWPSLSRCQPAGAAPGGAGDAWPAMRCLRARAAVGRAPTLLAVSGLQFLDLQPVTVSPQLPADGRQREAATCPSGVIWMDRGSWTVAAAPSKLSSLIGYGPCIASTSQDWRPSW